MLPSVGRIVSYTLPRGKSRGEVRPAMIVRVFTTTCVNLQIHLDGSNDAGMGFPDALGNDPLVIWETSVCEAPSAAEGDERLGRWFWPTKV